MTTETKNHRKSTGIGNWQTDRARKARWTILKVLSDGQWHRNMELKEKTSLSSRTLAKHLNRMTNLQIIERKKDVKSEKYPVPVLYRATPELLTYLETNIRELREQIAELQALRLPVTRLFHELTADSSPEEQAKYEQWLKRREIEEQKYIRRKIKLKKK